MAKVNQLLSRRFTRLDQGADYPGLIRDAANAFCVCEGPLYTLQKMTGVIVKMSDNYYLFLDEATAEKALEKAYF